VTLLLLLLVAGAAYLAWMWGPVFLVNYEVKQVVRDYMHQAVKEPNDAQLVQAMIHKLRVLDDIEVPDDDGKLTSVPTVQVAPEKVTWERDTSAAPPTIHVAFDYTRWVRFPGLTRWTPTTLSIDLREDLARPDWGPLR
jgi:hypothetical protein